MEADSQNAKAILTVVVGNAFDETRQNFLSRCIRLGLRRAAHEVPGSCAYYLLTLENCGYQLATDNSGSMYA